MGIKNLRNTAIHPEVVTILELVGIDPVTVPAKRTHIAKKHVELLVRFIGYREGLKAAKLARPLYDLEQEPSAILGDFIFTEITMKPTLPNNRSLFFDMRRMLALAEGATCYPMTSEKTEALALGSFLKAVINDIRSLKNERECKTPPAVGEQLPLLLNANGPSM